MWVKKFFRKNYLQLRGLQKLPFRFSPITPSMVGRDYFIHNGKKFRRVSAIRLRVGMKFGEFCFTRQRAFHKNKHKKKKNR